MMTTIILAGCNLAPELNDLQSKVLLHVFGEIGRHRFLIDMGWLAKSTTTFLDLSQASCTIWTKRIGNFGKLRDSWQAARSRANRISISSAISVGMAISCRSEGVLMGSENAPIWHRVIS
jgi:hypothetical protein